MKLLQYTLLILPVCIFLLASPTRAEHPHAKILGALVYTDLSIASDGEESTVVMNQLRQKLGVLMQVYWENSHYEGISRTAPIFLTLEDKPAIVVLERIMEQLSDDEEITWQIRDGVLEVGFKSLFSKKSSMHLIQYPISDLLFTVRDFEDAPKMGSGGSSNSGGGLTVGFGPAGSDPKRDPKQKQIDKIIHLITKFVEPDQWEHNGGECTIDNFQETLLISAPDYMHRQIGGYSYEPLRPSGSKSRRVDFSKGKTTVRTR